MPTAPARDAAFTFACQGCGAYCCTNEQLVLSPLELRRLVLALGIDATDLSARGWLVAFPDPATGLPRAAVEFVPVQPGLTACPFLSLEPSGHPGPLTGPAAARLTDLAARQERAAAALRAAGEDGGRALPLQCGAYAGRPIMCRTFPLQFRLVLNDNGAADGWQAIAHTRCPGHDRGAPGQTFAAYLAAGGVEPLAQARAQWHRLNQVMAGAGVRLDDHERASGSRRALWDAALNLLFASYGRPRLQVSDDAYTPALETLFMEHLAPVAACVDAEARARAGALSRVEAAAQLRRLVAGCQALEAALDRPPPEGGIRLDWPAAA